MISVEPLGGNAIKVQPSGKLDESDIRKIGTEADRLIKEHGNIKVLVDASDFNGWADMDTAKKHFKFVRDHHEKVERIALVAGHAWQHWLAGVMSHFVHPEIRVFHKGDTSAATDWLLQRKAAA